MCLIPAVIFDMVDNLRSVADCPLLDKFSLVAKSVQQYSIIKYAHLFVVFILLYTKEHLSYHLIIKNNNNKHQQSINTPKP